MGEDLGILLDLLEHQLELQELGRMLWPQAHHLEEVLLKKVFVEVV